MTVEELQTELETVILSLTSSGFEIIDSELAEKMDKLASGAGELGMKEGKRLIKNLSNVIKAIQAGKSKPESGVLRLIALDFYMKKLTYSGSIEDL
jgi:non-ribosomal peptide synthetase component E (peptide arylation enzyme)